MDNVSAINCTIKLLCIYIYLCNSKFTTSVIL